LVRVSDIVCLKFISLLGGFGMYCAMSCFLYIILCIRDLMSGWVIEFGIGVMMLI